MRDASTTPHSPPLSAFQSLPLTMKKPSQRSKKIKYSFTHHNHPHNNHNNKIHNNIYFKQQQPIKTPWDPLEEWKKDNNGDNNDDDNDDKTNSDDDHTNFSGLASNSPQVAIAVTTTATITAAVTPAILRQLHQQWSTSSTQRQYEISCLASFVTIFHNTKPPLAVVMGLWSQVVLPPLLIPTSKLPELIAQDVLTFLKNKQHYLQLSTDGTLSITQPDYIEFGTLLATDLAVDWTRPFLLYLTNTLLTLEPSTRQPQVEIIQQYAACQLMDRWLDMGEWKEAGTLLHQSIGSAKLFMILHNKEHILQQTRRMVRWMERYLQQFPASPNLLWQEALKLYQGWYNLLVQERNISRKQNNKTNTPLLVSSLPLQTTSNQTHQRDPIAKILFGRAMYTLAMSLDTILVQHPTVDPSIKVLWIRQCGYLVSSLKMMASSSRGTTNPLAITVQAASWIALSESCATLKECGMEHTLMVSDLSSEKGEDDQVICLKTAVAILESIHEIKHVPLLLYKTSLLANAKDALGRWLYDRGFYAPAKFPLEDAIKLKRDVVGMLREITRPVLSRLFGYDASISSDELWLDDVGDNATMEVLNSELGFKPLSDGTEKKIEDMEISLSMSLEYNALAQHACGQSLLALGGLQEALILKTTHLGKMSLEVARLNIAMAVVHEDMQQWEAGLSRYRECLRARMHHLSQYLTREWFSKHGELFRGILENLRSMGNAHRMLGEHDNAIGCFWKISIMSIKEWEIQRDDPTTKTCFCGFDNHRRLSQEFRLKLPLPNLVLEEERYATPEKSSSVKRRTGLSEPHIFDASDGEKAVLREAAQAYQTIISLFKDKAFTSGKKSESSNLGSAIPVEDIPVLLVASCQLGIIHIHFGDYRSAISSLELSLQCLWILDPASSESSGSDSYDSCSDNEEDDCRKPKPKQKRTRVLTGLFGKETEMIDDAFVYQALGICRAACGEFEQALRFHLTALRCARSIDGMNSLRAFEILYDTATTYWYLQEYDKALEFWSSSAHILTRCQEKQRKSRGSDDVAIDDTELCKITYNIGACYCALGRYDNPKTLLTLEEAKEAFEGNDTLQVAKANCLFYMAITNFCRANKLRDRSLLRCASRMLEESSRIYTSHGYFNPKNQNLPLQALQAHVLFMRGRISYDQGKLKESLVSHTLALQLYRGISNEWEIYVASVLHKMGKLHMKLKEDDTALVRFKEALSLRTIHLGRDHEAVGCTLNLMADIYARMDQFRISIDMYAEALRIQLKTEGDDSVDVAMNLLKMGALYARQGLLDDALEKLRGSLRIRNTRVQRLGMASQIVTKIDLAEEFISLMSKGPDNDERTHVRQALHQEAIKEEIALSVVLHCMGNVHVKQNDLTQARICFEHSLRVRRRHPAGIVMSPEGSIKLHAADSLHNLGCVFELQGSYDVALKFYAAALKLKHGFKVPAAKRIQEEMVQQGEQTQIILYQGDKSLDESYLQYQGTLSYAATLNRMGSVHYRMKNSEVAAACFGSALKIQKQHLGNDHFIVATTLSSTGSSLRFMEGRRAEALNCYQESLRIRQAKNNNYALGSADSCHLLYRMGKMYDLDMDYSRAVTCYRQAIEIHGYQYVNAVGRSLCEYFLFGSRKAVVVGNEGDTVRDDEDAFAKNIFKMEAISPTTIMEDFSDSHEKYLYLGTMAAALYRACSKQDGLGDDSIVLDLDLNAPECWISLELYLLSLAKLMKLIVGELQKNTSISLKEAQNHLEHLDPVQ